MFIFEQLLVSLILLQQCVVYGWTGSSAWHCTHYVVMYCIFIVNLQRPQAKPWVHQGQGEQWAITSELHLLLVNIIHDCTNIVVKLTCQNRELACMYVLMAFLVELVSDKQTGKNMRIFRCRTILCFETQNISFPLLLVYFYRRWKRCSKLQKLLRSKSLTSHRRAPAFAIVSPWRDVATDKELLQHRQLLFKNYRTHQ